MLLFSWYQKKQVKLVVEVTDGGDPPRQSSAEVIVFVDTDLDNHPPRWIINPNEPLLYNISETAKTGHVIATFETMVSGNEAVTFDIVEGEKSLRVSSPFRIESDNRNVSLILHEVLGYDDSSFKVRIRATVSITCFLNSVSSDLGAY